MEEITKFYSVAEEKAYPIIKLVANYLEYKLNYQETLSVSYEGDNYYMEYPVYVIDFVLRKNKLKIAIEIDSNRWHKKKDDIKKTKYLVRSNYRVIRIRAFNVLYRKNLVERYIINKIEYFNTDPKDILSICCICAKINMETCLHNV